MKNKNLFSITLSVLFLMLGILLFVNSYTHTIGFLKDHICIGLGFISIAMSALAYITNEK